MSKADGDRVDGDAARPISPPEAISASRATMREVAAAAGVSIKTVSRVVNEDPAVAPETAAAVRASIDRLRYRRNDIAKSLRRGSTLATIGAVITDLANPFFASVARGIEDVADERGRLLVVASSEEDEARERHLVERLAGLRVEGLAIVPAGDDCRYVRAELGEGTPVVLVDRVPAELWTDGVVLDNRVGGRIATAQLLKGGSRRVAVIGDRAKIAAVAERYEGYREAMDEAGLAVAEELVRLDLHGVTEAQRATGELLSLAEPPDAFFTLNNRMTTGALLALSAAGQDHVPLVGFDDIELAETLRKEIMLVSDSPYDMGRQAAHRLFARLDGDDSPPRRDVVAVSLVHKGRPS